MTKGVVIEQGEYGPRAVLTAPWETGLQSYLKAHGVVELELNAGKGWRGTDLGFLELLPDLLAFAILDMRIVSITAIHQLHKLLSLDIVTYCKTPIDFSAFPSLTDCGLEWRAGSDSLFDRTTLRRLFVNRCAKKTFDGFARLTNLESLSILGGPLHDLHGIEQLKQLRYLRLGNMRSLQSLEGVEELSELTDLDIQVCGQISSIAAVAELKKLKRLLVEGCKNLESIKPIAGLADLERVLLDGSTTVVDGDLTPLLGLKHLRTVSFGNRPHYSHRIGEVRTLIGK
jgi:hypothetical protein